MVKLDAFYPMEASRSDKMALGAHQGSTALVPSRDLTAQYYRRSSSELTAVSSKLPIRQSKNDFYRYYAGYPLDFAEWALEELALPAGAMIIDPWNGSGTTAAACARAGMSCRGYDINPVMVHLGRARVAAKADYSEAAKLVDTVNQLLCDHAVVTIPLVGSAFRKLSMTNECAHSIAIAALFPYARRSLELGKTKNPSWYRKGAKFDASLTDRREFFNAWSLLVSELMNWRGSEKRREADSIVVERGDSRNSLGRENSFDGFLTSPPYLTRLDYVQATLPELLLLSEFDLVLNMQGLRRSMIGSPLTSVRASLDSDELPSSIRDLLKRIKSHPSKASSTYYHRFFSTYFIDLQSSMRNLEIVLKSGAVGCIVVQPSNYKEIEVDLPGAVAAIGAKIGLRHYSSFEFAAQRSIAEVNSRAHLEARRPKKEFALFLRKD